MRNIANLFHIDVESIHNMWIVTPVAAATEATLHPSKERTLLHTLLSLTRDVLSSYCKTIVADIHDHNIVAFMDDPLDFASQPGLAFVELANYLNEEIKKEGVTAIVTVCSNLKDTAQTRYNYLQNKNSLQTARVIFPHKEVFSQTDIHFADSCRNLISEGEGAVQDALLIFSSLDDNSIQTTELLNTLAAYLLDSENDYGKCSKIVALHRNSVKYRLNQVSEKLGFKIGQMPGTMEAYTACALRRILAK
jgi:sugar diacid utilization regulator